MTVNVNGPNKPAEDSWTSALERLESMAPDLMSQEQKLIELVLGQREMRKLVKGFVNATENNPMFKTMGKMFGGK